MRRALLVLMLALVGAAVIAPSSAFAVHPGVPAWVNLRNTVHVNTPGSRIVSKTNGSLCHWLAPTSQTLPYACSGHHFFSSRPEAAAKYKISVGHAKRIFVTATLIDPERGRTWWQNGIPWTRSRSGKYIFVTILTPRWGSGAIKTIHVALRWD
jgi:hypothetical protein